MMRNVPVLITFEAEQYEFSGGWQEEYHPKKASISGQVVWVDCAGDDEPHLLNYLDVLAALEQQLIYRDK